METRESTDIRERAIIVRFSSGMWTATKTDKALSASTAHAHGAKPGSIKTQKKLIDPAHLEGIREILSDAKKFHNARTAPWDDNSGRLILAHNYLDYSSHMTRMESVFNARVKALINDYAARIAEARHDLNGAFRDDDYPPDHVVARKFHWAVNVEPIPSSADFRIDMPDDLLREKMKAVEDSVQSRVEEATRKVAADVEDHLSRLVDAMNRYNPDAKGKERGTFRDTIIGNLRDIVDALPHRNVTGDPALAKARDLIRHNLADLDPETLRQSAAARQDAADKARAILGQMAGYMGDPAQQGIAV